MTAALFANNATSALAAAITDADTSLILVTGQGALFPNPTAGDWFLATLTQATGPESTWEIVKCTARVEDTLTIVRAQEGTAAAAWEAAKVEQRLTAGSMPASGGSPFASDIVVNGINIGRSTANAASNFNLQTGNLAAPVTGATAVLQTAAGGYTILAPTYPTAGYGVNGVTLELVSGTCAVLPTVNVTKYSTFLSIYPPPVLTGASIGAVFTLPDVAGHWTNTGTKTTWTLAQLPDRPNNTLAIGRNVLTATTGNNNFAIGMNAGAAITSGSGNIIIGSDNGGGIATTNDNLLISTLGGTTKLHIGPSGQFGLGQGSSYWGTAGQALTSGGPSGSATWGNPSTISRATLTIDPSMGMYFPFVNANHLDITNPSNYTVTAISWSYYLSVGAEIVCQFLNPTTFNSAYSFPGAPTPFTVAAGDVVTFRYESTGVAKVLNIYRAIPSGGASYSVTSPVVLTGTVISMPAATTSVNGYMTSTQATALGAATTAVAAISPRTVVAMGALNIDYSAGTYFYKAISGASAITVSSPPATGTPYELTVELALTPTNNFVAVGAAGEWTGIACSSDGVKVVACLMPNALVTSTDSGRTWTSQTVPYTSIMSAVASSSDGVKLVLVGSALIATSGDSGVTWTTRNTSLSMNRVVSSADGVKLAAIGSSTTIWTSADSGVTWVSRETSRYWQSIGCSADGATIVAGAQSTYLYHSTDSGATWTTRTPATQTWHGIYVSADGTKIAGLSAGYGVYHSQDSGVTWAVTSYAFGQYTWPYFNGITGSNDGSKLFLIGDNNKRDVYVSTDMGVSWSYHSAINYATAICCSSNGSKVYLARYSYSNYTHSGQVYYAAAPVYSAVTWPTSFKWSGDTAPTLATTNILKFVTRDGGTKWNCIGTNIQNS